MILFKNLSLKKRKEKKSRLAFFKHLKKMSLPEYVLKDADEVRVPGDLAATPERGNCACASFCTTFTYSTSTAMG
jgi:hypothetical protein